MRTSASLCLAGLIMAFSFSAVAVTPPKTMLGKWNETGENGSFLWEIEADKVSFTPLDGGGKPMAERSSIDVLFEPVQDAWAVVVLASDGSAMAEGGARLKDSKLLLVLPEMGPHMLERVKSK